VGTLTSSGHHPRTAVRLIVLGSLLGWTSGSWNK